MTLHSGETLRARACHIAAFLSAYGARHWKWLTFLIWIAIAVTMVATRWSAIHWLVLGDTDDNIRYVQVKDWLAGVQVENRMLQVRKGARGEKAHGQGQGCYQ